MRSIVAALVVLSITSCLEEDPPLDERAALLEECDRDADCRDGLQCGGYRQCTIYDCVDASDCETFTDLEVDCAYAHPLQDANQCVARCDVAPDGYCTEQGLPGAQCIHPDQIAAPEFDGFCGYEE